MRRRRATLLQFLTRQRNLAVDVFDALLPPNEIATNANRDRCTYHTTSTTHHPSTTTSNCSSRYSYTA